MSAPPRATAEMSAYDTPERRRGTEALDDELHQRAVERDDPDLRRHPAPSLRHGPHRRITATRLLPLLCGAGRALPTRLRARSVAGRGPRARGRLDRHV